LYKRLQKAKSGRKKRGKGKQLPVAGDREIGGRFICRLADTVRERYQEECLIGGKGSSGSEGKE